MLSLNYYVSHTLFFQLLRIKSVHYVFALAASCVLFFGVSATVAAQEVIILTATSTTTWTVPDDWNSANNTVEVIGGGGGGGDDTTTGSNGGGGGGAYAKSVNVSLTPGATVGLHIADGGGSGVDGEASYFCNSTSNCSSLSDTAVVAGAAGGAAGDTGSAGAGGLAASSTAVGSGSVTFSGGDGGLSTGQGGGGGGGAAGPNGAGADGGGAGDLGGGGGGGNGGGSTGATSNTVDGGDGGNNYLGTGGGAGGLESLWQAGEDGVDGGGAGGGSDFTIGGTGGDGAEWSTAGSGGGGGGGGDFQGGGSGGLYGAGGGGIGDGTSNPAGSGAQGVIVITYVPAETPTWNATDWTNYDTITIDHTKVDDDLTDFPVYVDLSDLSASFWSTTPTSSELVGTDIRVTTDAESPAELPRELVFASSTAQTGELHFKANSISSTTDTTFRIYYNGTTTGDYSDTDAFGTHDVWSNNYVGVWHLHENGNNDPGGYLDSTEFQNAGSGNSMSSTSDVVGSLGNAQDFDGISDYISVDPAAELEPSASISYSAWLQRDGAQVSYAKPIWYGANDATPFPVYGFDANIGSDSDFGANLTDSSTIYNEYGATLNDDDWTYVTGNYSGSLFNLFRNGVEVSSSSLSITIDGYNGVDGLGIGDKYQTGQPFDGAIDELRIASTSRSQAWISAEYINQSDSTSFYTVATTDWNATDWTNYDTITIDHTKVDDDLTDFPVYVDLSDLSASFWSTTPTSSELVGTDIRVTTDAESPAELPRELVFASSTAQTGELHFKANSISSTTDTTFRIYYNGTTTGDYPGSAVFGADNVWTNDYLAVWHIQDGYSTAVNFYSDSTGNDSDLTLTDADGDTAFANGQVGKALDFNGDGDGLARTVASQTLIDTTISAWVNPDSDAIFKSIFSGSDGGGTNTFQIDFDDFGSHQIRHDSYSTTFGSSTVGAWKHVVVTNTTNLQTGYLDSVASGSSSNATGFRYDKYKVAINRGNNNWFDGVIDEVRIASTSRTTAWISAEYTNQSTTTDFYTVSSVVTTGSSTITNHTATQVDNAFNFMNKTNEPLFAFALTPESGNATTTNLELELSGVSKLDANDFSNIRLYRDEDNDALYDAGDTELATGTLTFNGRWGSITFSEDFAISTTSVTDYVVIADWNAPDRGSFMTVDLQPRDITITDENGTHTIFGSVDAVQHARNNQGGGGGSSSRVGTAAPEGGGVVTGGTEDGGDRLDTNTGGDTIGNAPDFLWPAAHSGAWTNGANAYDQNDGTYATDSTGTSSDFTTFNDSVPSADTIEGVEVKLEISGTTAAGSIDVQLSWDGGTSWTGSKSTPTLTTTDTVVTLGGAADTWGRTWSDSDFSNANFAVRLTGVPSGNTVQVDAIQVRVYHQASGGSSGGGGRI